MHGFAHRALISTFGMLGVLASSPVLAQNDEEGPKVQQIKSVERGLFVQADVGLAFFVNKVNGQSFGLSPLIGAYIGYDVLPILNIGVGVVGIVAGGSPDPDVAPPKGDLFFASPVLKLDFAVLTTERNFVWIRGQGGFAFGLPNQIDGADFGDNGPAFGLQVGYERFTKLRHFSVGITAGAFAVTAPDFAIAISIIPTIKYTF